MKEIAGYVAEGAAAYLLRQQSKVVGIFFLITFSILYLRARNGYLSLDINKISAITSILLCSGMGASARALFACAGRDIHQGRRCGRGFSGKERQVSLRMTRAIRQLSPIIVGLGLGLEAGVGLLVGALISGFVLAIMMANSGGAWDNAKKFIEEGNLGGKGSVSHKASKVIFSSIFHFSPIPTS